MKACFLRAIFVYYYWMISNQRGNPQDFRAGLNIGQFAGMNLGQYADLNLGQYADLNTRQSAGMNLGQYAVLYMTYAGLYMASLPA